MQRKKLRRQASQTNNRLRAVFYWNEGIAKEVGLEAVSRLVPRSSGNTRRSKKSKIIFTEKNESNHEVKA